MTDIPNISIVFKELSSLSGQVDHIINKTVQPPYEPKSADFLPSSYNTTYSANQSDRASRHQFLMQRLHNSISETRELLGQTGVSQPSFPRANESYNYSTSNMSAANNNSTTNSRGFCIPQIRYRHLEASKPKQMTTVPMSGASQKMIENKNQKQEVGIQYQDVEEVQFRKSGFSNTGFSYASNNNNKTNNNDNQNSDLFQRYYDICQGRRRQKKGTAAEYPTPAAGNQQQQERFRRSHNSVNDAINILMNE